MIATNLVQTVNETNDSGSAYETNVKYLLADKQILSRILKYTVEEFQEMNIEDILGCIGDNIEIGAKPADAGLSNPGRVKGRSQQIPVSWDITWRIGSYSILQG